MSQADLGRRFLRSGVALFIIGMLSGFVAAIMPNARMGLSAHVEGITNGMFLVLLGAIWRDVRLGPRAAATVFPLALWGTYMNFGFKQLAAIFDTGRATPIIGAGRAAAAWQENLVLGGLVSVGVADLVACALVLWGLRGRAGAETAEVL